MRLTKSNLSLRTEKRNRGRFCEGVNNNLSLTISYSVDMNDQTKAIVDRKENSQEKRMSQDKEEHASERKCDAKTKIDRKR